MMARYVAVTAVARLKPGRVLALTLAALLIALGGCSRVTENRQIVLPAIPKLSQPTPVTSEAEREHQRILAAYGGEYHDPQLHALIKQTVERLVAASARPDLHYQVTLLNSPAINAFALPTGQLYVTRGLAALANDSSELASVLAHEMSHVILRHAALRADKARQVALVSSVVNQVISDPKVAALALAKSNLALASFSRAQEFQADSMGVGISAHAGFDPYGAKRFLTDMEHNAALKGPRAPVEGGPVDFLSTHPATPDRIRNVVAIARRYGAPGIGERDHGAYLAALNGIAYGEDARDGYVRGRRFLHPRLGFTFVAPKGFTLDNTTQAVLGGKTGGNEALRFDVVSVPAEQTLTAYLASGWMEHIDRRSVRALTVNGFPAATATARGKHWTFRLYAIRFGTDVYRFIYAAKRMAPAVDRSFRKSVETFRRLTLAEIKAVKPLHISVDKVAPGDTVAKLAARMAVSDHAAERFRVLNGLGPRQQPKVGSMVKLVVE